MKVPYRIQCGCLKLQPLLPRTEHREEVALTGFIGFLQLAGLLNDEWQQFVSGVTDKPSIRFHLAACGIGFTCDLRRQSFRFKLGTFSTGCLLCDLTLIAIPERQRDGETEADKACAFGMDWGCVLLLARGKKACADIWHAFGFCQCSFSLSGFDFGL